MERLLCLEIYPWQKFWTHFLLWQKNLKTVLVYLLRNLNMNRWSSVQHPLQNMTENIVSVTSWLSTVDVFIEMMTEFDNRKYKQKFNETLKESWALVIFTLFCWKNYGTDTLISADYAHFSLLLFYLLLYQWFPLYRIIFLKLWYKW